jgi:hypothetical protein
MISTHLRQLYGSCGADKTCVFSKSVEKKNVLFLEKQIEIRQCVKLGKNANYTCSVFSEAYGRKATKRSSVL